MKTETDLSTAVEAPFCIDSIDRANWLVRKLANIDAEKKRVQTQAAAIVAQLEAEDRQLRFLFGEQLECFTRQELARRGGRRKSLVLLQGTCAFRSVPGGFRISDPAAALAYVQQETGECTTLIDLKPVLKTEEFRALAEKEYRETGNLLPGTEDKPDAEQFSVKFGKSE